MNVSQLTSNLYPCVSTTVVKTMGTRCARPIVTAAWGP